MGSTQAFHSRDDVWRLATDMKTVFATQIDHSDRLLRLERRQDEDLRMKSVWGASSPFPGVLSSTPQQESNFNPAAEAFRIFDQDQATSTMGSLHLDTEEEPRRGASRANSVRFDESALHGHFAHGSRSSSDILPARTGSGLGSHPMTERSSSHKSEGRQSSNGQSTHLSSLRIDTNPPILPNDNPMGPPPGLFLLGPLPSIIRCWLDTNFSNESLIYAAICTGSCQSWIQEKLARSLTPDYLNNLSCGSRKVRLNVFLPEAVVQQASSRPSSPAPQLPMISVEFLVHDFPCLEDSLQVVIGSDVLRLRNADILLSQDRLTLFDDRRNKVAVPLVRPENPNSYQRLFTLPSIGCSKSSPLVTDECTSKSCTNGQAPSNGETELAEQIDSSLAKESSLSHESNSFPETYVLPARLHNAVVGESCGVTYSENASEPSMGVTSLVDETQQLDPLDGLVSDPPATPTSGKIWGPWRRDPITSFRQKSSYSDAMLTSTYQKTSRGRGMKVLKPSKSSTSTRSNHISNVVSEASGNQEDSTNGSLNQARSTESYLATSSRSFSRGSKSPLQGSTNKFRSTNPVGSASAFGWLSPDQRMERKT